MDVDRRGKARYGEAWSAWWGMRWRGRIGLVRRGKTRFGAHGGDCNGQAELDGFGLRRMDEVRQGTV